MYVEEATRIVEGVKVLKLNSSTTTTHRKKKKITSVETDKGNVECDYFINCGGMVCPDKFILLI